MIGLFDSGLGGLTVLRRLRERLPRADVLYFADQANVPYGDRSAESLRELLRANVELLNARGCDAIVMACNTSCAIASSYGWPHSSAPIFDLIEAAASAVVASGHRRIAVVATAATVRSGAYARAIDERAHDATVVEVAAPALVPLIEARANERDVDAAVGAVCADLPEEVEALVYGCTHYPLVDETFARHLRARVERIDPACAQAANVAVAAQSGGFAAGSGETHFITSGPLEVFSARIAAFDGAVTSVTAHGAGTPRA